MVETGLENYSDAQGNYHVTPERTRVQGFQLRLRSTASLAQAVSAAASEFVQQPLFFGLKLRRCDDVFVTKRRELFKQLGDFFAGTG